MFGSNGVTCILASRTFFESVWHIHAFPSLVIWNYALHPLWQPQPLSPVLAPPPQQVHWPYRKLLTMYAIKREEGERVGEYGIRIALIPSRVRRIYLKVMNAWNSSPNNRLYILFTALSFHPNSVYILVTFLGNCLKLVVTDCATTAPVRSESVASCLSFNCVSISVYFSEELKHIIGTPECKYTITIKISRMSFKSIYLFYYFLLHGSCISSLPVRLLRMLWFLIASFGGL